MGDEALCFEALRQLNMYSMSSNLDDARFDFMYFGTITLRRFRQLFMYSMSSTVFDGDNT